MVLEASHVLGSVSGRPGAGDRDEAGAELGLASPMRGAPTDEFEPDSWTTSLHELLVQRSRELLSGVDLQSFEDSNSTFNSPSSLVSEWRMVSSSARTSVHCPSYSTPSR